MLSIGSGSSIKLTIGTSEIVLQYDEFKIEPEITGQPRRIRFSDGEAFETENYSAFRRFETNIIRRSRNSFGNRLERNWKIVTALLLAFAFGVYSFFVWGIPAISAQIAKTVPQSVRKEMSIEALDQMKDSDMLQTSSLDLWRRDRLQTLFYKSLEDGGFLEDSEYEYNLTFAAAPAIGKNAFALPSGEIVITDDLVVACNDEQVLAVLLHEIAHVEMQHGIRSLIQDAGIFLIVNLAIGDSGGVSSLVGSLPNLLAGSHYSQKFEMEADTFSCKMLLKLGYSTDPMREVLEIIHEGVEGQPLDDLLSTHPSLEARLKNVEKHSRTKRES